MVCYGGSITNLIISKTQSILKLIPKEIRVVMNANDLVKKYLFKSLFLKLNTLY